MTVIFAKGLPGQVERGQRIISYEVIGHSIRDGSLTQVNETVFHARGASDGPLLDERSSGAAMSASSVC